MCVLGVGAHKVLDYVRARLSFAASDNCTCFIIVKVTSPVSSLYSSFGYAHLWDIIEYP